MLGAVDDLLVRCPRDWHRGLGFDGNPLRFPSFKRHLVDFSRSFVSCRKRNFFAVRRDDWMKLFAMVRGESLCLASGG